MTCGLGIEPLS